MNSANTQLSRSQIAWSIDGDQFHRVRFHKLLDDHTGELTVGKIVFFGAWESLAIEGLLEKAAEAVISQISSNVEAAMGRFYAEGYPVLDDEQKMALTELLHQWALENLGTTNLFRVSDTQEYVITAEDLADLSIRALGARAKAL